MTGTKTYELNDVSDAIREIKEDFPGFEISLDDELRLLSRFVMLVRLRKKRATVRYARSKIRCPSSRLLPLIQTHKENKSVRESVGKIEITRVTLKQFGELTDRDAVSDGFSDLEELRKTLAELYGEIRDDELVSIYQLGRLEM